MELIISSVYKHFTQLNFEILLLIIFPFLLFSIFITLFKKHSPPLLPPHQFFPSIQLPNFKLNKDKCYIDLITSFSHEQSEGSISEYLFLLDESEFNRNLTPWYKIIIEELKANKIPIKEYLFYANPQRCWNQNDQIFELNELPNNQKLIIIGSGDYWIDHLENKLYPWLADKLDKWDQKALLLIKSPAKWEYSEFILNEYFKLAPATLEGFIQIAKTFNKQTPISSENWNTNLEENVLAFPTVNSLRNHLDQSLFEWICCCSIYPEIYWELILYIGLILESKPGEFVNIINISKLTKIQWVVDSKIPDLIRVELMSHLSPKTENLIRQKLSKILHKGQVNSPSLLTVAGNKLRLFDLENQLFFSTKRYDKRKIKKEILSLNKKFHLQDINALKKQVTRISRIQPTSLLQRKSSKSKQKAQFPESQSNINIDSRRFLEIDSINIPLGLLDRIISTPQLISKSEINISFSTFPEQDLINRIIQSPHTISTNSIDKRILESSKIIEQNSSSDLIAHLIKYPESFSLKNLPEPLFPLTDKDSIGRIISSPQSINNAEVSKLVALIPYN